MIIEANVHVRVEDFPRRENASVVRSDDEKNKKKNKKKKRNKMSEN